MRKQPQSGKPFRLQVVGGKAVGVQVSPSQFYPVEVRRSIRRRFIDCELTIGQIAARLNVPSTVVQQEIRLYVRELKASADRPLPPAPMRRAA